VLFTCGEFDEATPATTGYCHSLMPGSEIHVFQGASHNHHLEKPEEYIGVTRDFLTRNENFLNFAR
jgi:proline iminopeptidase